MFASLLHMCSRRSNGYPTPEVGSGSISGNLEILPIPLCVTGIIDGNGRSEKSLPHKLSFNIHIPSQSHTSAINRLQQALSTLRISSKLRGLSIPKHAGSKVSGVL
jgi:hypothetical protein